MAMLRIPHTISLPFGYRVTVKQIDDSIMNELVITSDSYWNDETLTIFIRKRLPFKRRVYLLAHELGHAWLDWQHRYLDANEAKP